MLVLQPLIDYLFEALENGKIPNGIFASFIQSKVQRPLFRVLRKKGTFKTRRLSIDLETLKNLARNLGNNT